MVNIGHFGENAKKRTEEKRFDSMIHWTDMDGVKSISILLCRYNIALILIRNAFTHFLTIYIIIGHGTVHHTIRAQLNYRFRYCYGLHFACYNIFHSY